jgi:dihydroorotase
MPERVLVRGGRLVDPAAGIDGTADLLLENGRIAAVGRNLPGGADVVIEAAGLTVLPGLVDAHVHLREPGQEEKETIESGTRAAACGGVTAVACMPNTAPPIDTRTVVEYVLSRPRWVHVHPIGAITKGRAGREITEFADLKEAGAVALSDDGSGVQSAEVMRRALEYARPLDLPIIQHCQEDTLSSGAVMHEGLTSTVLGMAGMPWTAEACMLARDLLLLEQFGGRLHVAHVSCRQSVELLRRARARGLPVTAEACPHHFCLTDDAVRGFDPDTKVNPPLREPEDVAAVRAALADGTIDVIASDHAPHTAQEKALPYDQAPFGISGVETLLALSYTELVGGGVLSLATLVERLAIRPRRLLALPPVSLVPGSPADLTVVDLSRTWTIDRTAMASRGRNTPFHGRTVHGLVMFTLVGGITVHRHSLAPAAPGAAPAAAAARSPWLA